jgi:hypothetical protein
VPDPGGAVAAFGSVWVQSKPRGSLWRLAPNGEVLARIHGVSTNPGPRQGEIGPLQTLTSGFGSIWTLNLRGVTRIDPATNAPVARVSVPLPVSIVSGMGYVWVAYGRGAIGLLRIDPSDDSTSVVGRQQTTTAGIAAGLGKVWWINSSEASSISAVDPTTGTGLYIRTPFYVGFVVPTPLGVWLINSGGQLSRIPVGSFKPGDLVRMARANGVIGVDLSGDSIWLNNGDLERLDITTGKVTHVASLGGRPPPQVLAGVAQLGNRVWIVDVAGQRIVGVAI